MSKTTLLNQNAVNDINYVQYFDRLTELAIAMFEWKNLPDSIDDRFLELALFHHGHAIFFKDEELGYLGLKCNINGNFNVYGIPIKRHAYAVNGYHRDLDDTNSVIIYNNLLHKPSVHDVQMMARRLYDFDGIISTNSKAQKTPVLLTCEEQQRLTLRNVYTQYEGNIPVIFGTKDFKPDSIKAISTGADFIADKMYQLKTQYWNESLTYLGIQNVNTQKKERLLTDEAIRSQGGVIASRYSRLNARKKACDEINKMFGLNIDVVYRSDYREMDDEFMIDGEPSGNVKSELNAIMPDLRTRSPKQ